MAVVGDELLPAQVSSALGLPLNLRLDQLDEQPVALVDPYMRIALGREVARCTRSRWAQIVGIEVMVSFGGLSAPELELSTRARNHLLRINLAGAGNREAEPLRDMTVSELASIPGFGAECLLEVLSTAKQVPRASRASPSSPPAVRSLERETLSPLRAPSRELLVAARALAQAPWSASVSREDPRLGSMVRAVNQDARSARDAAARTLEGRRYRLWEQRRLLAAIDALPREVGRLRDQPLHLELEGIVGAVIASPRSRAAALARLGLGGRPPVTLQAAGQSVGLTREAVRQIEKRFHEAITPAVEAEGVWAPALDMALRPSAERVSSRRSAAGEVVPRGADSEELLGPLGARGRERAEKAGRGLCRAWSDLGPHGGCHA